MTSFFATIGAVCLVGTFFLATRLITINYLTDPSAVFDTFKLVDTNWLYSDKVGAPAASNVERARFAIGGPLALSAKEVVYFVSVTDEDGAALQANCDYKVSGREIESRWWSITVYDSETQHYIPNALNRSSWNSASIPRSASGEWVIDVSPHQQDTTWLPTHQNSEKPIELMLRIYNPSDATRALLPNIDLPRVEKVSC